MIRRTLFIGRWRADFIFLFDDYSVDTIMDLLLEAGASLRILDRVEKLLRQNNDNTGFTFTNSTQRYALVVIGATSSGAEFIDTLVHEVHHLAVAIAESLGIDLESETPAYVAGDAARDLADIVCLLGCRRPAQDKRVS